ncbi:MAG: TM2 domain-containing protein [Bacteroidales bacterium]|jgi:hypothetical protein|nr:TM2 domain-containing protein [Bacteroidales bacterium]
MTVNLLTIKKGIIMGFLDELERGFKKGIREAEQDAKRSREAERKQELSRAHTVLHQIIHKYTGVFAVSSYSDYLYVEKEPLEKTIEALHNDNQHNLAKKLELMYDDSKNVEYDKAFDIYNISYLKDVAPLYEGRAKKYDGNNVAAATVANSTKNASENALHTGNEPKEKDTQSARAQNGSVEKNIPPKVPEFCPSCGAKIENSRSCEYCGWSMDGESNENKPPLSDDSFVYPGLVDALNENIRLQIKHNGGKFVATNVDCDGYIAQFVASNQFTNPDTGSIVFPSAKSPSISVRFDLDKESQELSKFQQMDTFSLFTPAGNWDNGPVYAVDIGEDVVAAAQLYSKIMKYAFGCTGEETCEFDTWSNKGIKGSNNVPAHTTQNTEGIKGSNNAPIHIAQNTGGKNWLTTLLLCLFLGWLGVHRFYTKNYLVGVLQFFTFGCIGLWTLIDFILILVGSYKDGDGQFLVKN